MSTDDRMETITDPALIRATDDPDERGDFPCCADRAHKESLGGDSESGTYNRSNRPPAGPCTDERTTPAPVGAAVALDLDAARAMLNAANTIKATGGAVEIGGVRIEPCDEYGSTVTTARAEAAEAEVVTLRARLAAVEAHPVVLELAEERTRQTAKHGDQSHLPDGTGAALWLSMDDDYIRRHGIRRDNLAAWAKARTDEASQASGDGSITFEHILTEEWAEAIAESDPDALRAELVQVAAVAVQWIEAIDLRAALATTGEGQ